MLATRAGTWGVYARHLDTGETVAIRADEVMPAQSSVKVCVLLAYTKRIRLGDDDRNRRVTLLGEDHELGSGVLRYLAPGLSPTLEDLAWLMIVLSDNIATRALIRELGGREVVNAEMDALGVSQLRLHDSLQQGASYFTATPHDLAEVYTHLDEHAREILYRVEKVDFLPRRIPHVHAAIDHDLTAPVRVYGKAAGERASASTRVCSRRTRVHGLSPRWRKIFPTSGRRPMTTGLAPSPTSEKRSTRGGTSKEFAEAVRAHSAGTNNGSRTAAPPIPR